MRFPSRIRHFIYLLFIFCFLSIATAQDDCNTNSFSIQESYFNDEIVAFYLGAINVNTGAADVLLFDYSISSTDDNCYNQSNLNLYLQFTISIYSPQLGFNEYEEFLYSKFKFSQIINALNFKNTDMDFSTNSIFGAESERIEYTLGAESTDKDVQTIINSILLSGKIPNGSYIFDAVLSSDEAGVEIIDQVSRTIDVFEPQYIELLTPGGELTDTLQTIEFTQYPVFTWQSDNCSTENCNLSIRLCEYNPYNHSNLNDAMESNSHLPNDQTQQYYSIDSHLSSFQYPVLDAESLQPGKYYAWQLRRVYETTVGREELFSDIFVFKIHAFEGNVATVSPHLDAIKNLIGDDNYRSFFDANGELSSFTKEITEIKVDGNQATISNLYDILSKVNQGSIEVKSVKVE
jgi:hypothetical protein